VSKPAAAEDDPEAVRLLAELRRLGYARRVLKRFPPLSRRPIFATGR